MAKKILIIEDEKIITELLEKKLTRTGYKVVSARDGEEGLEKMKECQPDLILLDVVMPKVDGFGVLEAMQKDEALKKIPVIVISNSGQPLEIERAKSLGAKDLLIKADFDPAEVLEKVKNALK